MAYEALDSLIQTLTQILKRNDDLTTHRVKRDIISIRDKAIVLQLELNVFPEKETIKKVASTTLEIIEYLFSPENLSNCGSIEPTVRVSNQLTELAEELDLIAGDVVDYCKVNDVRQLSDYPTVSSSSSRSAHAIKDAVVGINEDPTVSVEPTILKLSHRLGRFAEKILSSPRDLADYSRSNDDSVNSVRRLDVSPRSAPTSNDVAVGIDEDLSYSAADIDEDLSYSSAAGTVSSSSRPAPTIKDGVVVGFDEDRMQTMGWLISDRPNLQVLSIVGMAGIGKTTLAKIVYDHPCIMEYFDIRAWVTMSEDFSLRNTCLYLLTSIYGKVEENQAESDGIENYIYESLYGRRYLIIMDNIWSTEREVGDALRYIFPDNKNGSRIILTTRLRHVAAYFSRIHEMRFLDEQQSWHLFERKVFADQTCPLELQSVAKKIVRNCGGLPLSIVTMAERLSGIGTTPKFWEQILATDGDGQLESILSLSYNHLPHHLKECFLYMAGFPEDYKIRVSELIKLWVAEGFLEGPYKSKSLEETAEEYLKVLIENSLVLVTSRKIDGKIKSCRLHNMVRDFCVRQAGQKKFLLPVMDYLPTPILRRHFLPQLLQNHRRISASWYDLDLKDSMHSSCTHSIICIPHKGYKPKGSVRNFRSLRILHVLRRNDHSYWELGQVFDLIHLRYLASNIPSSIVPPAISKLQNLQTLIIYRSGVRLPMEIWGMRQLRHLIAFSFDPLPHPEAAALPLENLQTLSLATNLVCSRTMVKMIPNIQKLGICYSGEKFDEGYHLNSLAHLFRLEKLKLEMHSDLSNLDQLHKLESFVCECDVPVNLTFPHFLKKLSLHIDYNHHWDDMLEKIGSLRLLQKLILSHGCFRTQTWETVHRQFPNLKVLKLRYCGNLVYWTSESSHFPQLERLVLERLRRLNEIPSGIGEIQTLQSIVLKFCSQSVVISAKRMQEELDEVYGEELAVRFRVKLSPRHTRKCGAWQHLTSNYVPN